MRIQPRDPGAKVISWHPLRGLKGNHPLHYYISYKVSAADEGRQRMGQVVGSVPPLRASLP